MFGYIYFATVMSVKEMFVNQRDLADFTAQTDHHEPNLSFHLANELWKFFPWLNCDFDVKKTDHNKRPDIIFHRRGCNTFNLLVVEVKRQSSPLVNGWICQSDEEKISNYWFAEQLNYPFGVSLVMNEKTSEFAFALSRNNPRTVVRFASPNLDVQINDGVASILERITAAKRRNPNAQTQILEHNLDMMVCRIYRSVDTNV